MHIGQGLFSLLLAAGMFWGADKSAMAGNLTVYSAAYEAAGDEIVSVFQAQNPDIHVQMIRDSAGALVARILAERDNPRADAVIGLVANALVTLDSQNLLEAYEPAGIEQLKPGMKDDVNPVAHWIAQDVATTVICFNIAEAGGIAPPQSWQDLADPKYKGKIVMPNPGSSGTGLIMIAYWLQLMGEDEGWNFMRALNENITQYVHSGSAPCRMSARGETLIGLSYPLPGVEEINKGAPLQLIIPPEGSGAEVEGSAIVKGTKNLTDAQKFADFLISEQAQQIVAKYSSVVARQGVVNDIPNYPAGEEERMQFIDYVWLVNNKQELLEEWKNLFDAKSAPRN